MAAPPHSSESLAIERTILAHERTLMAWSRTSVSMTSFGFTIYSFLERLPETSPHRKLLNPRVLAMLLAGTGAVMLVLAMFQYRISVRDLEREAVVRHSLSMWTAGVVALIGLMVV